MKNIIIISEDIVTVNIVGQILSPFYNTVFFKTTTVALNHIYESPSDLLIIDLSAGPEQFGKLLKDNIKDEPLFLQLPILAIIKRGTEIPLGDDIPLDDFIWRQDVEDELLIRVKLSILRSQRIVEINPLTRLPGNISICRELQARLAGDEIFAFAHADLDYFKPFNDKYGFGRGDDIIKATGRIILNVVKSRQPQNSFVGHIGGDDFVYIADPALVEVISAEIIAAFDGFIPIMYEPEDRRSGFIMSVDRQGIACSFPLLTISIGITDSGTRNFLHYGEVIEAASQMKSVAKKQDGSIYCLDQRRNGATDGG